MALRHGLHRNQLFSWRRRFRGAAAGDAAKPADFIPITIAGESVVGRIELVCGEGAGFDAGDLRRVLQVVRELR